MASKANFRASILCLYYFPTFFPHSLFGKDTQGIYFAHKWYLPWSFLVFFTHLIFDLKFFTDTIVSELKKYTDLKKGYYGNGGTEGQSLKKRKKYKLSK